MAAVSRRQEKLRAYPALAGARRMSAMQAAM
jgi:hypothetical protein